MACALGIMSENGELADHMEREATSSTNSEQPPLPQKVHLCKFVFAGVSLALVGSILVLSVCVVHNPQMVQGLKKQGLQFLKKMGREFFSEDFDEKVIVTIDRDEEQSESVQQDGELQELLRDMHEKMDHVIHQLKAEDDVFQASPNSIATILNITGITFTERQKRKGT